MDDVIQYIDSSIHDSGSIECRHCHTIFIKENLNRSCGNCFVCSSCVIYICPICRSEIVVNPMKSMGSSIR